ncbi:MAG: GGDEF domain-containing protein, partial [Treponema sp.]|nr:GGDEF domain-containing protein [Treponema sp.]
SISRNDKIQIPKKVILSMFVDGKNDVFEPNESFNPQKELLPKAYVKGYSGYFFIHPIFSGENNYGYIICSLRNQSFSIYSLSLRLISNSIAQAYELTNSLNQNEKLSIQNQQLQQDKTDLSIQSKTDELTKILNRRGFLELAEKNMDLAKEMGSTGLVIFMDLDGLKTINDNHGHKMGDLALKAFASVITQTFRANDIVGRLSGDEFAAIAVGMNKKQLKMIHDKIDELCLNVSKEKNFPFILSCSMGATEFSSNKKNITKLLIEADKELYIEKNEKHKKLNKS